MLIQLNPDPAAIKWEDVTTLFEMVGWGHRPAEQIRAAFAKSSVTVFVFAYDKLIGFGRTVDDGIFYALLVDVVVHPQHQNKGIGKQIVNSLKDQLQGYRFITLTSAPDKAGFYKKIGWKKQS